MNAVFADTFYFLGLLNRVFELCLQALFLFLLAKLGMKQEGLMRQCVRKREG